MGALSQLGNAVNNFVAAPAASISNAFAQADKDLSLSQNALPILGAGALAASSGLIPGIPGVFGGAAGTGAGLSALDAGMGTYGTASAMPAALGGGVAGLSALDAGMGAYGTGSAIGNAGVAATGGLTASQALSGANLVRNLLGGTGMATTNQQQQSLGSLLGGLLQQAGGAVQGGQSAAAAEEQARLINEATQRATGGAQFRPVGITTRYGTSQFQVDPTTGQLVSAGYQVTPEQQALQNRLQGLLGQGLTQAEQAQQQYAPLTTGAQGLFGLGQQYLATSPQQAAADYMARQQALLQPSRDVESARLATQLQRTGRTGLATAQGGELGAANPEQQALANARAMQDLQLAAQAQQAGQQATQFGAGLLGSGANLLGGYYSGQQAAYAPFTSALGQQAQIEQLAQQPLSLSQQLAALSSAAGGKAGQLGIAGTTASAAARMPSLQYSPLANILSGAGGNTQFGNLLGQAAGSAFPSLLGLFSGGNITPADISGGYNTSALLGWE